MVQHLDKALDQTPEALDTVPHRAQERSAKTFQDPDRARIRPAVNQKDLRVWIKDPVVALARLEAAIQVDRKSIES